jgi:dihydrofolate synthase/folylpolyglutamate synthase
LNYQQALDYLHSAPRFKGKAALERMRRLCGKLGNPQNGLRTVHVAGTNGKGSTVNMIAAALYASGYRTGMFISPYVLDFRERIQVNGRCISQNELAAIAERVRRADEELAREGLHATEFELVTACGLCYFRQQRCDVAVLEVGLGGRFDATNVIDPPEAAVITKIALDHTAILGGTLAQIAFEKCGILKGGYAVCYPSQEPEALQVIRTQCTRHRTELHIPDISAAELLYCTLEHTHLRYGGEEWDVPLGGRHQVDNALTAMETLDILRMRGWRLPARLVRQGISSLHFPARLERVNGEPPIYIDGAHNPDGMRSLITALGSHPFTAVYTAMRDKDYRGALELLAGRARRLIVCALSMPRAASAQELAEAAADFGCPVLQAADIAHALRLAREGLEPEETIVICGSLYLAGEAHVLLDSARSGTQERS